MNEYYFSVPNIKAYSEEIARRMLIDAINSNPEIITLEDIDEDV